MDVLVTGGTGFVGSYLCDELAARGHDVTAMARDPRSADFDREVETVRGDVTSYDSIEAHFEEIDCVVQLVALSPLFKPDGGDEMHFRVHRDGTKNAVKAAETHNVDRFVQLSALGADPDGPTAYIRAKGEAEELVEAASLDSVIYRPSVVFGDGGEFIPFTRKLATPYLTPLPGGGKTRFQPIYVEELVQMVADGVEGTVTGPRAETDDEAEEEEEADPHIGNTYELGGPEKLTLAEVAELAWAAKRKPVSVVSVPMSLAGLGLSLLDAVPGAPMGSDQYRSLRFDNTTSDNAIEVFGWTSEDLTTLQSYLNVTDAQFAEA
ncbi:complex I NDUFA9 subunit family protein [Halosegnis sp.]|uniref:complex I NDUFA9 subunit family protein n=1 Tax=Halosegnis sp. TaxID=2864959 RepID=UPI0035D4FDCE